MLGKIFIVCMLLSVSACLVRSQPTSKEKIAGVADDVAKLLSKLGVQSTDEAVAKLWAKGGELSDDEAEVLGKLFRNSNYSAMLAALQRPVTSKLHRLDNMVAEYHKGQAVPDSFRQRMLADIDETLTDINANMAKYGNFGNKLPYYVDDIKYSATSVLQLSKIQGVDVKLLDQLVVTGEFDDVVAASLLTRNFYNIRRVLGPAQTDSQITVLSKVFKRGNLENDIYPIYNALIGENSLQLIASRTYKLESLGLDEFGEALSDVKKKLSFLKGDLEMRTRMLKELDISDARKAEIKSGSVRYLRGAGKDGEDMLGKMSLAQWAKNIRTHVTKAMNKYPINKDRMVTDKRLIDEYLQAIEVML